MHAQATSRPRRAIGIVRVSRVGDRDGERFVSPDEQRRRVESACVRDSLDLVDVISEMDVSGGTPLKDRVGLRRAVEAVEAGTADVIVVAFFDRLVRSLTVQAELVGRVEQAGGQILAVDVGQISNGSAGQWLSGTMLGAVAEYHRRSTAERTVDAKRRAVARGVAPFATLPPGLRRGEAGQIEPDPAVAPVVADGFRARAAGATVKQVHQLLRANGVKRSPAAIAAMLRSRLMVGELHFGADVNLVSHPAIVDPQVFEAVQRMRSPRGRRAKSELLLARLGLLRCASCDARMVVNSTRQNGVRYSAYRCPQNNDCPQRVTVSARLVERVVVDAVRALVAGLTETETSADGVADGGRTLERCEQALDAAVQAFTGLEDVASARERLLELHNERDEARDRLADLQAAAAPTVTINAGADWDTLLLTEQRALIRAVIERVTVTPGRGPGRITVEPRRR